MRRTAALGACAATLAILAAACTGGGTPDAGHSPSGPASPTAPAVSAENPTASLRFSDCTDDINGFLDDNEVTTAREFTYGCGYMRVPLDWAKAQSSKHIKVLVLRIRAKDQKNRIGSLVINPGGPGAAGTDAALGLAIDGLPQEILDRFDIVGFDPRGTGGSNPIVCTTDAAKDAEAMLPADPKTDAQFQQVLDQGEEDAHACTKKYGADLTYYSTLETARDMEALRSALGEDKLTYLGYSYGTYLGAVYATLFPDRVRAFVLDGAVDPTVDDEKFTEQQTAAFEHAVDQLAFACTKAGKKCPIGPDARASVMTLLAEADAAPIPAAGDERRASSTHVLVAVGSALYSQESWGELERAVADALHGDSSGILSLYDGYTERDPDGHYSSLDDANGVIGCADGSTSRSVAYVREKQKEWRAKYPMFGGSDALGLLGCTGTGITPDAEVTVHAPGAAPILVIGTKGDPATPYAFAAGLAKALGPARVLTWEGEGHTAYPQTACINAAVDAYLISLTMPATGATCPAGPLLDAGA